METDRDEADNTCSQADEIEALMAIYEDWKVEDAEKRVYSITLHHESTNEEFYFQVRLPPDYPSESPPIYEISAPWMSPASKEALANALEDHYCTHLRESILYDWVDIIKNFLTQHGQNISEPSQPTPPALEQLTLVDVQEELQCEHVPEIFHGETFVDRRSVFQAHLAAVTSTKEVEYVLTTLKQNKKIAEATHNIWAYRIVQNQAKGIVLKDSADDGETHAGNRLLHLLDIVDAKDVYVVVTRWYGGTHLGPDRFKHINNCARDLLLQHGYIKQDKTASPGEAKNKEKRRSTPKRRS
ncbi:protein IMPACT-A-like [Ornithodoros turicata]|uniref:protein IMPACT-A-like n=1 Tax=Ornithodoros turicata TaxID=34597 RepID=UPI003139C3C6